MQSAKLLANYLNPDQLNQLAADLSKNLTDADSVNALLEVIDLIDQETLSQISPLIRDQCQRFVLENNEDGQIFLLLLKLPNVFQQVMKWIATAIVSLIKMRLNFLCNAAAVEVFRNHIEPQIDEEMMHLEEESLVNILQSLDKLLSLKVGGVSASLDMLICFLLTIQDASISTKATKLLRWRDSSVPELETFIWDLIPCLMESGDNIHISNGYILWLRYLTNFSSKQLTSEILNHKLQKGQYWRYIQNGMGSTVHEHRKYCLSILKLSIQQLDIDVDNEFMYYNKESSSQILEEWKKYCTLFEIVGIDTALNQAEAAKSDIHQLLSPDSFVKSSWGMVLLSTGFKGSMESVRKFSLNIMLSCSVDRLPIYAHEYLTSVFLRYAVEAPHFLVKKTNNKLICEYGLRLENFIISLLKSLRNSDKFEQVVSQLLDLLVDLTSIFAPARLYLSLGLLKGLKGKQILDQSQVQKIYRLFDSMAEDEVFEKSLQTIHLKMLCHLKRDTGLLLESLTKFIQYNGYELFGEHFDVFLDYVATFHDGSDFNYTGRELEYQIVTSILLNKFTLSNEFLLELAYSKVDHTHSFSKEYSVLLTSLVNTSVDSYEKATSLINLEIFKNSWRNLDLSKLYDSLFTPFDLEKFEFFVNLYAKSAESSDVSLFNFKDLLKVHKDLKNLSYDYKRKDAISAGFFDLTLAFIKMTPLAEQEVDELLELLDQEASSAYYLTNISICNTLQYLMKNYDFDFINGIEILEKIWEQITSERLVLNQKLMHLKFIETLFDEKLLKDSINNEYNAKIIQRIGLEIIDQSFTRRSFLPTLTSKIMNYQKGYSAEFNQTFWLIEVLVKSFSLVQDESNLFRLKPVLAKIYDDELKFHGDLYEEVFGPDEVSAKINVISILVTSSVEFTNEFFQNLIQDDKYSLLTPNKKANGTEERQRISSFALLLLVSRQIDPERLSNIVAKYLLPSLVEESSPLVRSYIEWIVSIDMINSDVNREALFGYFKDQSKPALVTSVERIAFMTAQKLPSPENVSYFDRFTQFLIPNCTSNKPLIRHFSNSLILSVFPELISKKIELPVHSVLEALYIEAKKSEVTGQYRSGDALIWDVEDDFTLTSIFGGVLSKISPREVDAISQAEFEKYYQNEAGKVEVGSDYRSNWKASTEDQLSTSSNVNSPLQTKSGAWESVIDLDENTRSIKRSELIVVSSLVDKPPNLGGICRLCDVLGAGLMTVDDLRVKKHPQFKNVAVTADYWMPITEVQIKDIPKFMKSKKREGYTLIGLEQTDQSIVLGKDTEFPSKSLILLGREAEGIPGELLAELDYCIEIRQMGVIRSMNIQTATAVIVHAYSSSQASK